MTSDQFQQYMHDQIKSIEVDKWCEGERIGCDPGQKYVMDWIKNNSVNFRKEWESKNDIHT